MIVAKRQQLVAGAVGIWCSRQGDRNVNHESKRPMVNANEWYRWARAPNADPGAHAPYCPFGEGAALARREGTKQQRERAEGQPSASKKRTDAQRKEFLVRGALVSANSTRNE